MTQHAFVQQISYLEGSKSITPPKETLSVTLENVHARLNELERVGRQPQPPTIVPDWESLRYRAQRLWRDSGYPGYLNQWLAINCDKWWPSTDEMNDAATAVVLERTLRSLGIISFSAALHDNADDAATDCGSSSSSNRSSSTVQFDIAAQEFCHLAGKSRKKPRSPFLNVRELYAGAIELSLTLEGRPACPNGPPPPVPGPRPPGMPMPNDPRIIHVRPGQKRRSCCGCCSCKCHEKKKGGLASFFLCGARSNDAGSDSDSDSDAGSSRRRRKGWRRFLPKWGWLSKGRKKRQSGYGSDSSSGSNTIID